MKFTFIPLAFSVLFAGAVRAGDQSSGCGVGWMVFKEQSLVSSTLRASTNATFLNTIAMTFGTSGCAKHKIVQKDKAPLHFAESNGQQLMLDVARGEGEYLAAFAATLGCADAHAFGKGAQENFARLYPGSETTPAHVVDVARQIPCTL